MLWTLIVVLFVLWLLGFSLSIGGGLVHLLDDESLRADQSVAEVLAAIGALASGELEMAIAMYRRLTSRWRTLGALEQAS